MKNLYTQSKLLSPEQFKAIEEAFQLSWSKETSFPNTQEDWSEENKAYGQCAVTALIVHDLFGGEFANDKVHNHIWNILPDGTEQDFSREQMKEEVSLSTTRVLKRENVLDDEGAKRVGTPERYQVLKEKFEEYFKKGQ